MDLKIKINKDIRCFKQGQEFTFPLAEGSVNFMMSSNGTGKTTLMHFIRAKRHDLSEINKRILDGMQNHDDQIFKNSEAITIDGTDSFDKVYVLDSIDDDPTSFINAATAMAFIDGGGMAAMSQSKGKKALAVLSRFFNKIYDDTHFCYKEYCEGKKFDKKSLIIIDEADEGLDLATQKKFCWMLMNASVTWNATVICITHNIMIPMMMPTRERTRLYDLSSDKLVTVREYIIKETDIAVETSAPEFKEAFK